MKRLFRGRSYNVKKNIVVLAISELVRKKKNNQDVFFTEEEMIFWKEMKLDVALKNISLEDETKVSNAIKETILLQYNSDISDTLLLHYLFLKNYMSYLKNNEIKNGWEDIFIEQKIFQRYGDMEWCEKYCNVLYHNCVFLNIIDAESGLVDNTFIHRWMYYPVSATFIKVMDDIKDYKEYFALKQKEYQIYTALVKEELHFEEFNSIFIKKDGKKREICVTNTSKDKLLVNYLAKRMREVFNISFPDRDQIMEIVINLIDALPQLQDYTIYRFDFKNFFKSVSSKLVYEKYIKESDLCRYEKNLILELIEKTENFGCAQGLATSNVLVEIIAQEFDNSIKTFFADKGIILYERYVDDGIIIFNKFIGINELRNIINSNIDNIFNDAGNFNRKVTISADKENYQTKYLGIKKFDYLGYSFYLDTSGNNYFYRYGIAENKLEKYKNQLKMIYEDYVISGNQRLLYHRLLFFNSRIVYYDYSGYKYKNNRKWEVRGLINTYRMLRRYMIYNESTNKIMEETEDFLKNFHRKLLQEMYITYRFVIPDFLKGKGIDTYSLWCAFEKNHSIVFQANIGWNIQYLVKAINDITGKTYKGSYTKIVNEYLKIISLKK